MKAKIKYRRLLFSVLSLVLLSLTIFAAAPAGANEYDYYVVLSPSHQRLFGYRQEGPFATHQEAEAFRQQAARKSGDYDNMYRNLVIERRPSQRTQPAGEAAPSTGSYGKQAEQERQRQEQEKAEKERNEAFEREKEKLLKGFKGRSSTGITGPETGTTSLPLKGSGNSQTTGLNPHDPAIKERTMKAIKQLNCSAYWALNASGAALKGDFDTARRHGEFSAQAKGGNTASGCPEIKVYVPDVPPPVETNPQIQLYNHIIRQAGVLAVDIIETRQKIESANNRLENTKKDINVRQEKIKEIDRLLNHPRGKKEVLSVQKKEEEKELDELEKLALELQKDAAQLNKNADGQRGKLADLQGVYESVKQNPQRAKELIKKVR
jgi:hypothetical protein